MPRAYYRVPIEAWEGAADDGETSGAGIEQHRTATTVYVLAAHDPSPRLEALGGVRIGGRLSELPAAQRGHFTESRVRRLVDRDGVPTLIEERVRGAVRGDDELLEAGIPRVVFAGDDPADYR